MSIQTDTFKLEHSATIVLYILDATALGAPGVWRWYNGANGLNQPVVWQGNTYEPYPMRTEGWEHQGKGPLPRPKLQFANIGGLIGALAREYSGFTNAKFIRKRTLGRFLDAVNFPGGVNPSADPNASYADDIYFVDRKSREDEIIEFELAAAYDVMDVKIPFRQIKRNVCGWEYRSGEGCGYAGPPVADINDTPTNDHTRDRCGKRLKSCKLRFGANAELPYEGFPAAGLVRL